MKAVNVTMAAAVLLTLGCARLRVEGPKEPIKVDVSMRLDIYQHVAKDINDIESIVTGAKENIKKDGGSSLLRFGLSDAYAQEGLPPEVERAALDRRNRRAQLVALEAQGAVGENKSGLVEIRIPAAADGAVQALVSAENSDRMVIYQAVAKKNATSVEEVQKLYIKRLQEDAPQGTPIEVLNEVSGAYEWKAKK